MCVSLCACRMWFVDLAGSERASETKQTDRRNRIEGAEINQSLLSVRHNLKYFCTMEARIIQKGFVHLKIIFFLLFVSPCIS